jgi:hypothetical protein
MADKPKELTPEQQEACKIANAAGFINQLVTDGRPDPEKKEARKTVTLEEAGTLYKQACAYQAAIEAQVPKVIENIRAHLKETQAKAA